MFGARGGTTASGAGEMLKTFRRASRTTITGAGRDSYSQSSSSYKPILSSNLLASSSWPSARSRSDDMDWVSVDETGHEIRKGFYFDDNKDVFGEVPDKDEVLNAVSALQLVIDPTHYSQFLEDNQSYNLETIEENENSSPSRLISRVSSFGSESDWMEPSMYLCYPKMLERQGSISAYGAFNLLQTEPSIKRMVISLSSDKAVWEAVLNNEMVQELRDSLSEVGTKTPKDIDDNKDNPETVTNIFSWVYVNTKVKLIEIVNKIAELVNEFFQLSEDGKTEESTTGRTEEMVQISLLLSIMVLIIVVLDRTYRAS